MDLENLICFTSPLLPTTTKKYISLILCVSIFSFREISTKMKIQMHLISSKSATTVVRKAYTADFQSLLLLQCFFFNCTCRLLTKNLFHLLKLVD
jgi:hypothetical protein